MSCMALHRENGHVNHRIKRTHRLTARIYMGQVLNGPTKRSIQVVVKAGSMLSSSSSSSSSSTSSSSFFNKTEKAARPWNEWHVARRVQELGGHRNIVKYYDTFIYKQTPYLVMQHCNEGDLYSYLASHPKGRLPEEEALRLVLQIARGLHYLHQHNIAHQDLSLENILLDSGVAKICDFGASTLTAKEEAHHFVGTPQYVAPEVEKGEQYSPVAIDIWALGIVFLMLITGAPLVNGELPEILPLSTVSKDLLANMLRVNPAARFQSMRDILNHPAFLAVPTGARRISWP